MDEPGTVGAVVAETAPPQQPSDCDKNVAGWPKMYPIAGSDDQEVAQTYTGALPGLSISR
jgi:hypothetical protein